MSSTIKNSINVFKDYAGRYLNRQAYALEDFKEFLSEPEHSKIKEEFKVGLEMTMDRKGLLIEDWDKLAETMYSCFEDQSDDCEEDFDGWMLELRQTYDYLFNDGSIPKLK